VNLSVVFAKLQQATSDSDKI